MCIVITQFKNIKIIKKNLQFQLVGTDIIQVLIFPLFIVFIFFQRYKSPLSFVTEHSRSQNINGGQRSNSVISVINVSPSRKQISFTTLITNCIYYI